MLNRIGRKFGVQSKFLALVLFASLASLLLTGFVSFGIARHLLTEAGYNQLIGLRNARAEAVNDHFSKLRDHALIMSEAQMTVSAIKEFTPAFAQLPDINPTQKKELERYYLDDFLPKLKKHLWRPKTAYLFPHVSAGALCQVSLHSRESLSYQPQASRGCRRWQPVERHP
jgi:hypothetical protein